jgi:hypothetical protein
MHRQSAPAGFSLRLESVAGSLTALGAALCFLTLITASGPHLVHHLADQHPGHPCSHTDNSQPTECLVLASVQHAPVTSPPSIPAAVILPEVEGPGDEPLFGALTARRLTFRARSPPSLLYP